jgi:GTP-binding protein HflX
MLFATLDTTVRTFQLPDKRVVSLTDTIGFIRKLPHHLVESFKSTLDEVIYSDLIIHVVDASSETAISQIVAVERVLGELKCMDKPMFLLLNKSDLATEKQLEDLKRIFKHYTSIEVSAAKQTNIDLLLNTIIAFIPREEKELEMLIPYDKSTLVSSLYKNSQVLETEHLENGTKIKALVSDEIAEKYKEYIIK